MHYRHTYLPNRHLIPRAAIRTTGSSAFPLLTLPTMHTNFGRRAFSYSAPDVWNNLPPDVLHCNTLNTFKKHLKTRLMTCHQAPLKLCSTALYKFVYYYYYYYYSQSSWQYLVSIETQGKISQNECATSTVLWYKYQRNTDRQLTVSLKYVFMPVDKDVEDGLACRVERTVSFDVRSTAAWRVFNVSLDPRHQCVHV